VKRISFLPDCPLTEKRPAGLQSGPPLWTRKTTRAGPESQNVIVVAGRPFRPRAVRVRAVLRRRSRTRGRSARSLGAARGLDCPGVACGAGCVPGWGVGADWAGACAGGAWRGGGPAAAGGGGTTTGGGGSWTGGGSWIGGGGWGAGGGGGTGIGRVTVTGRVGNVIVGRLRVGKVRLGTWSPLLPEAAAVQKPSTAIAAKNVPRQINRSRRSVYTSQ
jgi:hypothetical protein